jgi:dihydrofolate reductase
MTLAGRPTLALIWAMARNRVIGRDNTLPWRLPADLRHFRAITTGHPVIMGRKTFESLGKPLPGRTNIVLTRDASCSPEGCLVARDLDEALALAAQHTVAADPLIFIIGGENLYRQTLPRADRLYITLVDTEVDGDAHFPDFPWADWQETARVAHAPDEKNACSYTFLTLQRKTPRP